MAKRYAIQLMDHVTRTLIQASGGTVMVVGQGTFDQVALQDSAGASVSNPSTLTNGLIEFFTANSQLQVDLYGWAPGGEFFVVLAVDPSGPNEIFVDTGQMLQVARIPFSHADSTDATVKDTGFDLPQNAVVLVDGMGIHVGTVDAGESIEIGILASESNGDEDGFMDIMLTSVAGFIAAEVGFDVGSSAVFMDLTGGDAEFTYGAFMCAAATKVAIAEGADSDTNEGFYLLTPYIGDGTAESITYTTTSGTNTADGLIILPYMKAAA